MEVFAPAPPGVWKVVVATNIAETSITIPDVVYVIDYGLAKVLSFDAERNASFFRPEWIAKQNAIQRAGRAGRVRPGMAFHLYPRAFYTSQMRVTPVPEMLASSVEDLVLQTKVMLAHSGIQRPTYVGEASAFLARALEPPTEANVKLAVRSLQEMGALDQFEALTDMGHLYSKLPVQANQARAL